MIFSPEATAPRHSRPETAAAVPIQIALRTIQILVKAPEVLFLVTFTAILLRPPDVPFYEIDHIAFVLLLLAVACRILVLKLPMPFERVSWPMLGLTFLAFLGSAAQPFDNQTWAILAAKTIVPFAMFHMAIVIFDGERQLRQFEIFSVVVLAYLCFTSIAFLIGAKALIFPRFILDESVGFHADRARGPLLQAVANGVSLNMLGLLALHARLRGRIRGLLSAILLASIPIAILATMTRAVWLSFAASTATLIFRLRHSMLRRICVVMVLIGGPLLLLTVTFTGEQEKLGERLHESGPVDYREAVYTGCWEMFVQKPFFGWGINQIPAELASHVSGYQQKELYPHNTYLELLVEHGLLGLALYIWIFWEILRLGRGPVPSHESNGVLNQQFHTIWPLLIGIYLLNAALVVMNYQFVNGFLFTMAGMLAAQRRRAQRPLLTSCNPAAN